MSPLSCSGDKVVTLSSTVSAPDVSGNYYATVGWTTDTFNSLYEEFPDASDYCFVVKVGNQSKNSDQEITVDSQHAVGVIASYHTGKNLDITLYDNQYYSLLADKPVNITVAGTTYPMRTGQAGSLWAGLKAIFTNQGSFGTPGQASVSVPNLSYPISVTVDFQGEQFYKQYTKTLTINQPETVNLNTPIKISMGGKTYDISNLSFNAMGVSNILVKNADGSCVVDDNVKAKLALYLDNLDQAGREKRTDIEFKNYLRTKKAVDIVNTTNNQVALTGTITGSAITFGAGISTFGLSAITSTQMTTKILKDTATNPLIVNAVAAAVGNTANDVISTVGSLTLGMQAPANGLTLALQLYVAGSELAKLKNHLLTDINNKISTGQAVDIYAIEQLYRLDRLSQAWLDKFDALRIFVNNVAEADFNSISVWSNFATNVIPFGSTIYSFFSYADAFQYANSLKQIVGTDASNALDSQVHTEISTVFGSAAISAQLLDLQSLSLLNTCDRLGPTLSINSHTDGESTNIAQITLLGTAIDSSGGNGVSSVKVNNTAVNTFTPVAGNVSANWAAIVPLVQGNNVITVEATDAIGNNSIKKINVTFSSVVVPNAPDLAFVISKTEKTVVTVGQIVALKSVIKNYGISSSPTTSVDLMLSNDSLMSVDDTKLGATNLIALTASSQVIHTVTGSTMLTGNFWVYACITPVLGESNTKNNCSTPSQITIVNLPVNTAPAPTAPAITVTAGQSGTSQIQHGDTDVGDSHTYSVTTLPTNGTATVDANGFASYTPSTGYSGLDSFTVTVTDNGVPKKSGAVTINVTVNAVIAVDSTSPVLTLLGQSVVSVTQGQSYTDAGATAVDNVDGNITANIVTENLVNTSVIGSYTVTYNVSDAAGNPASQMTRVVNVVAPATWTKHTGPVLSTGAPGTLDDAHVYDPNVIFDTNTSTYRMYYSMHDGVNVRPGLATSTDGLVWQKSTSNPMIQLGSASSWDDTHAYDPNVIFDGQQYQMWYSGYDGVTWRIGHATSADGFTWIKDVNPVVNLGASGSFDSRHAQLASVLFDGATYRMWYSGHNGGKWSIGYATSTDGVTWSKHATTAVLNNGTAGQWDRLSVHSPSVIKTPNGYEMWYTGGNGVNRIGHATSVDGIVWIKDVNNPVISLGTGFDSRHASRATVIDKGNKLEMWYSGHNGASWRIGYASMSKPVVPSQAGFVGFRVTAQKVDEADGVIKLVVSRHRGSAGAASVNYTTQPLTTPAVIGANGSAQPGFDYTSATGTLTWANGDLTDKYISVPIVDDATVEGKEVFGVQLSNAVGAALGQQVDAVVLIVDNDRVAILDKKPVVKAPANIRMVIADAATSVLASDASIAAFLNGATASDAEDGVITNISNNAPASFLPGVTRVRFSVTDSAGNTGAAEAAVMVKVLSATQAQLPLAQNSTTTSEYVIPFSFTGTGMTKASDLMAAIGAGLANGSVSIQKWDVNLQQRVSHSSLNDFALNVGDVYFVSVTGDSSLNLTGTLPANPSFTLVKNVGTTSENMLFLNPGVKATYGLTTASSLIAAIKARMIGGTGNVTLQKWDSVLQQRVSSSVLNDFILNEGDSYFISVSESVQWPAVVGSPAPAPAPTTRFTKLNASGLALVNQGATYSAKSWDCVRDSTTGLMWEVKATAGLRNKDYWYSWYDSNPATNGGVAGTPNRGFCADGINCDTEKFVAAVNASGLCGFSDWRMPSRTELLSLVDTNFSPTIDTGYFPNANSWYWSSSSYSADALLAWNVYFYSGNGIAYFKSINFCVRVVR
ncbi:MAG: DUF1566 domain-containing protein [Mariprofundaceae bacterium]